MSKHQWFGETNNSMIKRSLALFFLLLSFTGLHANPLREHLSVFFEFNALDSVIALEQKSATVLQVTVVDGATGDSRKLSETVGAKPMQKFLQEANEFGLKTIPLITQDATQPKENKAMEKKTAEASTMEPAKSGRSVSSQRKNRMWYIAEQTVLSTYVYGIAIPRAFDAQSAKINIATPMIVAPLTFGAHFWFSKNRPFEDSHRKGIGYLSLASLYASYALPFSFLGLDEDQFRVASILTLGTYPASIYAGYLLGDKYVDLPGRIDTQQKFAFGLGAVGFFSPFLYFDSIQGHGDAVVRLALGQSVAMAVAGHFLADYYRTGQNIPTGVNTGIMHHSILGMGLGLEVAALSDASEARPWIGGALLGGTLGFMEGLYYYRNRYDSQERGLYNTLGGMAGTLLGGGLAFLFVSDNASQYELKASITSLLVGGTFLGYLATNILTDGMEERTARAENLGWTDHLALNPLPFPEPQVLDHGNSKEIYWRYRIPGVSYTF